MEEIYSEVSKITPKPFFVSALIVEAAAVVIMIAVLLSLKFITPKIFSNLKEFYTENICFNVLDENLEEGNIGADEF